MKFILYLCGRVMPPCIHKRARKCKSVIFTFRSFTPWKFSLLVGQMPDSMQRWITKAIVRQLLPSSL